MNCVQTNLFMPYLCHVNLLTLIMFNKSNKKETMTNTNRDFKQAEKILTETINIAPKTGDVLVSYALMYSNLTDQGKKQAQEQLRMIGVNYDKMINKIKGDK